MCETDTFLWNAGIFLFRAKDMLKAFQIHAPNFLDPIQLAIRCGEIDLVFSGSTQSSAV